MKKKVLLALVVSSLLVLALAVLSTMAACAPGTTTPTTPAAGEKIAWRHQCAYTADDMEYIALTNLYTAVSVATGGKFVVETFPAETVVPTDELLSAVAEGVVEVGHAAGGYWKGIVPVANIEQGLPAQYTGTLEQWHELQYDYAPNGRTLEDIYREAYAKVGVFHFGGHSYDGYPCVFSTVPIRTLSDYQGIIVRVSGAPGDVFAALGASVTWLPGAELYMALKLGTIDVACWSVEGMIGYKWFEIAHYVILPPMSTHSTSQFLINPDAWDKLPTEYQEIYETAYHEIYIPQLYALYQNEWNKLSQMAEPLGYELITLPDADVKEMTRVAMEVVWPAEEAKAPECKEATDIIKSYYGMS
jgi:TRAP-type mannitol/chloroaromatic compound transport system substrate-binding protein